MKVSLEQSKYILAVSGGVDSMVLLHLLANRPGIELIVAHFDHGIRQDSAEDAELVKTTAKHYGLVFELGTAKLGKTASEEVARNARYKFLSQLQVKHKAKAIITAHHQDDLIETALINVIRGTGRLGLSAIANNKQILRPLIGIPKQELLAYTQKHKLQWREDSTNQDTDYLRNYLRINILAGLTVQQRQKLISNLDKVAIINIEIDSKLATLSQYIGATDIDRNLFSGLPSELGNEVVAHHLRRASVSNFDSKTVGRLSMAIKTSKPSSTHPVKQNSYLRVGTKTASIVTP